MICEEEKSPCPMPFDVRNLKSNIFFQDFNFEEKIGGVF